MTKSRRRQKTAKNQSKKVMDLEEFFDNITSQYCVGTGQDSENLEFFEWAHICRVASVLLHLEGVNQVELD